MKHACTLPRRAPPANGSYDYSNSAFDITETVHSAVREPGLGLERDCNEFLEKVLRRDGRNWPWVPVETERPKASCDDWIYGIQPWLRCTRAGKHLRHKGSPAGPMSLMILKRTK